MWYFMHAPRPHRLRWATTTKFGTWGGVADIINRAKFHANQYIGFGFLMGQKLPFSYA